MSSGSGKEIVKRDVHSDPSSTAPTTRFTVSAEVNANRRRIPSPPPPPPEPEILRTPSPPPVVFEVGPPPPPPVASPPIKKMEVVQHGTPPMARSDRTAGYASINRADFVSVQETTAVYKTPPPLTATPKASALKSSGSAARTSSVQFSQVVDVRSPASSVGETDYSLSGLLVEAMFDYSAATDNQMMFKIGDSIKVLQEGKQGWVFGQNLSSNRYCRSCAEKPLDNPPPNLIISPDLGLCTG